MEDPWANAWGEPASPDFCGPGTSNSPSWVIGAQKHVAVDEQEDDIGMPSWSTAAGVSWNEPSDVEDSLWSQPTTAAKLWEPSAYEHIPIGRSPAMTFPESSNLPHTPPPKQADSETTSPPPEVPPFLHPQPEEPPSLPSVSGVIVDNPELESVPGTLGTRHGSPDAFGTFESAAVETPWTLPASTSDPSEWGSGWGTEIVAEVEEKSEDEWETAKLQKEKQDRRVPPELLESILRQFEEFSQELWPEQIDSVNRSVVDERSNLQGIQEVEGLAVAAAKLIPQDLTLPPAVQFSRTAIAKNMSEAIRLTRHVPLTRLSPMAQFMVSKGSTAWEAAVKARPDVIQEDLPPGWRILEKKTEAPPPLNSDANKGKKVGGLLSFWGRKAATPPPDHRPERSTSPAPVSAIPTPKNVSTEPSPLNTENSQLPSTTPPKQSVASSSKPIPAPHSPPPSVLGASIIDTNSLQPEVKSEPTPPPSVVSRFLNRFSRTKGPPSVSSSPDSLDLSSDDLEFLSDIVPSASDMAQKPDSELSALNTIRPLSLPNKLPPPLPPPKPPTSKILAGSGNSGLAQQGQTNGLISLFDPPDSSLSGTQRQQASFPPKINPPLSILSSLSSTPLVLPKPVNSVAEQIGTTNLSTGGKLQLPLQPARSPAESIISPPVSKFPQVMMATSSTTESSSNTSTFKLPPPPSSRSQTPLPPPPTNHPLLSSNRIPPIPAPSSQVLQPVSTIASLPPNLHDNDDFSGFHSLPPLASTEISLRDASFSSVSSNQSLFSQTDRLANQPNDSFDLDDFDDFVSSPIRTPTPPRPPSKSVPISKQLPSMPKEPPKRKASRAAEHSRTLSLVETAAARRGRWPAPPSPLPHALPPPGSPDFNPFEVDLLDGGSIMQNQQNSAMAELKSSMSTPAAIGHLTAANGLNPHQPTLLPPVVPVPSLSPLQSVKPPLMKPAFAASPATPTTPTISGKGGLSAQDLSFFEGL